MDHMTNGKSSNAKNVHSDDCGRNSSTNSSRNSSRNSSENCDRNDR